MKRIWVGCCLVAGLTAQAPAQGVPAAYREVRAVADRVNLRAAPSPTAEVVGQAAENQVLSAKTLHAEWVEIVTPATLDLYVHRDFVQDGVSKAKTLNVRAGPGINYTVVGTLPRGAPLDLRGEFGEWLKIAPPDACSLWVSREYVEEVQPPEPRRMRYEEPAAPPADPAAATPDLPAAEPPPATAPAAPAVAARPPLTPAQAGLPADWKLIPLEGQGRVVELEGQVRRVGLLARAPTDHELVAEKRGRLETVCYLRGRESVLAKLSGQRVTLQGRQYWVRGFRVPILVVEQAAVQQPAASRW